MECFIFLKGSDYQPNDNSSDSEASDEDPVHYQGTKRINSWRIALERDGNGMNITAFIDRNRIIRERSQNVLSTFTAIPGNTFHPNTMFLNANGNISMEQARALLRPIDKMGYFRGELFYITFYTS